MEGQLQAVLEQVKAQLSNAIEERRETVDALEDTEQRRDEALVRGQELGQAVDGVWRALGVPLSERGRHSLPALVEEVMRRAAKTERVFQLVRGGAAYSVLMQPGERVAWFPTKELTEAMEALGERVPEGPLPRRKPPGKVERRAKRDGRRQRHHAR